MVDILGLLPILNGWNWVRVNGSEKLNADDAPKELYESENGEFGWLISARVSTDVADAGLRISYDPEESGQSLQFSLIPQELYDAGYFDKSNMPYVANYDPAGKYTAEFTPQPPLSLKGTLTITAVPGSTDATVNYDVLILEVTDIGVFVDSLRVIFGIETIIQLLNQPIRQPERPRQPVTLPPVAPSQYTGFLP